MTQFAPIQRERDRPSRELLAEGTINPCRLAEALGEVGIDSHMTNEETIYVTGLAFNFWIKANRRDGFLVFSTYAPLAITVDHVSALRFANELNDTWSLIQFSTSEDSHRLYGFYMLSFRGGILHRQFLRTVMQFPTIFSDVLAAGRSRGILAEKEDELTAVRITSH